MVRGLTGCALLLFICGAANAPVFTQAYPAVVYTLYVATTGSDTTGDGSSGNPWATVQKARDVIRTNHWNLAQTGDITVNIGAGDYTVASTIAFGPNDSGGNGHNVKYVAQSGVNTVRFLGGQSITGWATYSGSISRACVSGTYWTMWENETRGRLARTPNYVFNASWPEARSPYLTSDSAGPLSNTVLQYLTTDINPASWTAADLQVFTMPGGTWMWTSDNPGVTGINTTTHQFTLNHLTKFPLVNGGAGSRYIMQGDLSMLDQCGEYYADFNDTHGSCGGGHYLYYWPCSTPIASQNIVVPTVQKVFSVAGLSASVPAHNLVFDSFEVEYSDYQQWFRWGCAVLPDLVTLSCTDTSPHVFPSYGYEAAEPAARYGMFNLSNVKNVTLQNLHLKNAGLNAVFSTGVGSGCVAQGNHIEHLGGGAYYIENNYPPEGDVNGGWLITDGKYHDFGELASGQSGVSFANSGGNTLSYSEIYNGPRRAIWMFADSPGIQQAYVYAKGNLIDHVLVHNAMQDTGDAGAIAISFLDSFSGGPFVQNTVNQVISRDSTATPDMTNFAPVCIYSDNDTYGQIYTNVQASGCQGGQAHLFGDGTPVLTNTSFLQNGSANGSFNAGLMDTANIGVTSAYLY